MIVILRERRSDLVDFMNEEISKVLIFIVIFVIRKDNSDCTFVYLLLGYNIYGKPD